jgi:hypothetical protein
MGYTGYKKISQITPREKWYSLGIKKKPNLKPGMRLAGY